MSSRLKRMVEVLVGVALAAAIVAAVPGVAEAQDAASTKDVPLTSSTAPKSTSIVVVRPGDSLWSISYQWLGPNATPRRITEGVEQIYALNRDRIGVDPNLIFAGQKLLVPPAVSERSTGEATGDATRATTARKTTEAAEAGPRGPVAKSMTDKAPRTALGGAAGKDGEAPEPVTEPVAKPVTLPDAAAAPGPAVGSLASDDPPPSPGTSFLRTVRSAVASATSVVTSSFAQTRADGRRLLGLGIIMLTVLVTALMAWKLPMRRTTRWDAERWGIPTGYYGSSAHCIIPFAYHPGSLGARANRVASGVRNGAATNGRVGAPKAKAVPRHGLALGAHNPEVRRALLRARAQ